MVERALKITGIEDLRGRFIDELSGGQRQMAHIAMSIAQDTKYILLDEPLNNLDMSRSVKIMKLLRKLAREESKTILIVIHDINFVSFYADQRDCTGQRPFGTSSGAGDDSRSIG